jgi:Terpene synthase family 2, C-terminal metal binding
LQLSIRRDPNNPDYKDETALGPIIREYGLVLSYEDPLTVGISFWKRSLEFSSPSSVKHFTTSFEVYMNAVHQQAVDRDYKRIRSVKDYFQLRRGTIGAQPLFDSL